MQKQQPNATAPIALVARAATAVWIAVSAVNFAVWLAVSLSTGDVDSPWFLWAFSAGAVVVGGLRFAARVAPGSAHSAGAPAAAPQHVIE